MKIDTLKIKNFRGYLNEVSIDFNDFTALIGKNDIGKSSIMEALDIFFNDEKGAIKLDKGDINIHAKQDNEISIAVCFSELPEKIVIDASNETTLSNEYLLNADNKLEIVKKYPKAGKAKVFIRAFHPTNPNCADLLSQTNKQLRDFIEAHKIPCNDKIRDAVMRSAIWQYYKEDLDLSVTEIEVTKTGSKSSIGKSIWDKLQGYLPLYSLFQSDRKNCDSDNEVQDPLKVAVKEILKNEKLQQKLGEVAKEVEETLKKVSDRTLDKLKEMSPEIANTLNPSIPETSSLKWADVFKSVSITSDENIPINKRGSGVKRLILLNFFRAEVEHRKTEQNAVSVIYAIEEPETSQHTENQLKIIHALLELSKTPNTQIIISTHSSHIVLELALKDIRIIMNDNNTKVIENVSYTQLPYSSMAEINYLAFSEVSNDYHNALYGYIEEQGWMKEYQAGKGTREYIRLLSDGNTVKKSIILSEYIRHEIHHPENTHNIRFTEDELRQSIEMMREFISKKNSEKTLSKEDISE